MLSLFVTTLFLIWLLRAGLKRPAFLLAGLFLIWQFALKIIGVTYLDVAGPVFSDEVMVNVGGSGSSAPLMALFIWVPLAVLYFMLRPAAHVRPPRPEMHLEQGGISLADLTIAALTAFAALLYIDLLRLGNIPLLTGTERFEYRGGIFHRFFQDLIFLLAFVLGYVFARGRLVTGTWDLRCIALFFAFFFYLVLTGHRFGAFYVMTSYLGLALAALYWARDQGWPIAVARNTGSVAQRLLSSRVFLIFIASVAVGIVAFAMFNSLYVVRDYGDSAGDELFQRLVIQPVHLYWLTWEQLQLGHLPESGAFDFIFNNAFDAHRNTGIQYLMYLHLGASRAATIFLDQATDYAGGFPDAILALAGVELGLLVTFVIALITAGLYRLALVALCRGHLLTSVFSVYVGYGFIAFFLGGSMTFFNTWTYGLKIFLLIISVIVDQTLERSGSRLFPWIIVPRRNPSMVRTKIKPTQSV